MGGKKKSGKKIDFFANHLIEKNISMAISDSEGRKSDQKKKWSDFFSDTQKCGLSGALKKKHKVIHKKLGVKKKKNPFEN